MDPTQFRWMVDRQRSESLKPTLSLIYVQRLFTSFGSNLGPMMQDRVECSAENAETAQVRLTSVFEWWMRAITSVPLPQSCTLK